MFFDAIVIFVLLGFAIFGYLRGMTAQLAPLVAIFFAFFLSKPATPMVSKLMNMALGANPNTTRSLAPWIAGFLIFLMVYLIGILIEKSLIRPIIPLKWLDRTSGIVLSMCKGVIVILVVYFLVHQIPVKTLKAWSPKLFESKTYQWSLAHNPLGSEVFWKRVRAEHQKHFPKKPFEKVEEKEKKKLEDVIGDYLEEQKIQTPKAN